MQALWQSPIVAEAAPPHLPYTTAETPLGFSGVAFLQASRRRAGGLPAHGASPHPRGDWYVPTPTVDLAAARAPSGGGGAAAWRAPARPDLAPARLGLGGRAGAAAGARPILRPAPVLSLGCAAQREESGDPRLRPAPARRVEAAPIAVAAVAARAG